MNESLSTRCFRIRKPYESDSQLYDLVFRMATKLEQIAESIISNSQYPPSRPIGRDRNMMPKTILQLYRHKFSRRHRGSLNGKTTSQPHKSVAKLTPACIHARAKGLDIISNAWTRVREHRALREP